MRKGRFAAPYISVVVPAWNEEKYIGRTLRSLLDQSLERSEYEIIVVDGHSKDGTVAIARKLVDRVLFEDRKSIGYARNVGARAASGEIVAFIDADSIATRNWLLRIKKIFRRRSLAGVGGFGVPINPTPKDRFAFLLLNYYWKLTSWLGIYHFVGFNCAYRRKEFLAAGGYNPDIRFLEDVELSIRFRSLGNRCKVSRRLKVLTSPRRISQKGLLRILGICVVGYWCLLTKTRFPWDYAHEIDKHGKVDR